MNLRILSAAASVLYVCTTWAATEVRLAVHDSFDLPKDVISRFEREHQAKVSVIKLGDGNEMLNRLIITRSSAPLADAVFGIDNNTVGKAQEAGILAAQQPAGRPAVVKIDTILPVDYGFVTINYDKKWFADKQLPLPQTLADLTKPEYKNLLAMPNPGTSTPGLAFLLANISGLGEEQAFDWWAKMRQNGVKITKGWSDAYNTEFTLNGGSRPMMVGYASSPAAEVYYSEGKLSRPNMGNLFLAGGSYLQVEGAAVLNRAKEPQLAGKLVQYLQNSVVQQQVFSHMWVYPAVRHTPPHPMMIHTQVPPAGRITLQLPARLVHDKQKDWVNRWVRTVIK